MRHTRARRRFKLILAVFLAAAVVLFLESRIGSFAPQAKDFAELKIEEAFDKRFKLSIGTIDGGILHPFTMNDCKITDYKGDLILPQLKIDNIVSNYRIWDFLFRKKDILLISDLLAAEPRIDVKFASHNNAINGFMRLEGAIDDARVRGYVNLFAKDRIDFTGRVKTETFEGELKSKNGVLQAKGSVSKNGNLTADLKLEHFKIGSFDIVCDAVLKDKINIVFGDPKKSYIDGELETKGLVLDDRPFSDLKISYKIADGVLDVSNLEIGNDLKGRGKVGLSRPYNIDVAAIVDNASFVRILSIFNAQDAVALSGTMNGKFEIKGTIKNPMLSARIDIRKGNIAEVDFEYLTATLKGEGPIVRIEDSRITRKSGPFILAGEMDFSKAGKGNIFQNIKVASPDTALIWDDWNVTKMRDVQEVTMKKKMSEEVGLSFKKFVADEKIDESMRETDEYELEYSLNSNEILKFKLGGEINFVGVEHKNRF